MIVAHFHIVGVIVIAPDKTCTALIVDPDAMLAFALAFKRFEPQAGAHCGAPLLVSLWRLFAYFLSLTEIHFPSVMFPF